MAASIVSAEQDFELSRTETYVTEHYVFHYQAGTLAEKEIKEIAQVQERAFSKICGVLVSSRSRCSDSFRYYISEKMISRICKSLEDGRWFVINTVYYL